MSLQLYNTLTKKKELFTPLNPPKVTVYICGVTVYDHCHIGHARAYVVFDIIRRYLKYKDYDVQFVQNFTDIDDKIIARANERGIPCSELTEAMIGAYFKDMALLNIEPADTYPKATDYITEMQTMIQILIEKGHAYEVNGDVCFSVESFKDYGKLSKKVLEDLVSGSRVQARDDKKNPLDFVLWKKAKSNEPSWDSPWGTGRPGWHIECSAMATQNLGPTIDIHGGGADLIFPHHENEIAQSECATNKPFAQFWVHNGFVTIKNEKMSKSTKNFFLVTDILKEVSGEALRFFLMRSHYRSPLNFTMDLLKESEQSLDRLHNTCRRQDVANTPSPEQETTLTAFKQQFMDAMDDDINFTAAIGVLFDLNKFVNKEQCGQPLFLELGHLLGLFYSVGEDQDKALPIEIDHLIEARAEAKKNKDFAKADALRAQLLNDHHIILEDTAEGTRWKRGS